MERQKEFSLRDSNLFYLKRAEDMSGVSGTGIVAVGIRFRSGAVMLKWNNKKDLPGATGVFESVDHLLSIHGHNGKTKIVFIDEGAERSYTKAIRIISKALKNLKNLSC